MLCSQFLLRKRGSDPELILPLPCRSWHCEWCAPKRRRQLMAQAAAGEPNKLLTLTVNAATGDSSAHRRDLLHLAWKNLVKRINRQFQMPPLKRWRLDGDRRSFDQACRIYLITAKTPIGEIKTLPYFAFLERTKRGEPHLHILLRCPFIPQDWLSEQMLDLLGSPVVWIEQIKGSKHAIAYVTKYVTKAPAQWGNKKRYWASRNWPTDAAKAKVPPKERFDDIELIRTSWADFVRGRQVQGWTFEIREDGWYQHWRPAHHPEWSERYPGFCYPADPPAAESLVPP